MESSWRTAAPAEVFFKGRPGDARLGEWVKPVDSLEFVKPKKYCVVIYGNPDDLGVRLNRGRAGAAKGPDSIRRHLYKMTLPMDKDWEKNLAIFDLGNTTVSSDILETHRKSFALSQEISRRCFIGIALGGGHDFAAPTFMGFSQSAKKASGLINVDPHLDVREEENGLPNSGTPFRQIIESGALVGKNFIEFGARASRNAKIHWDYCKKNKVRILQFEALRRSTTSCEKSFRRELATLVRTCERVGVTFDMDCCCESEGVSAPPVLGFSAWELTQMAAHAGSFEKVRHFEIGEVAPELETGERSSRIAAEMIYAFLSARTLVRRTKTG